MSNPTDGESVGPDECVEREDPEAQESFDLRDELDEAFGSPRPTYVGGEYSTTTQGLPQQIDDNDVADAHAPAFLADNQCCHADRSEYVLRDDRGRVVRTFKPEDVSRDPDGQYRAETDALHPATLNYVRLPVVVEPKRPECKHLVRQLKPLTPTERATGYYKHGWMHRYCAARRSTAGAFLELTDKEMAACSLRDPYDNASAQRLDDFDDKLRSRSENRENTPMFDLSKQFLGSVRSQKEGL